MHGKTQWKCRRIEKFCRKKNKKCRGFQKFCGTFFMVLPANVPNAPCKGHLWRAKPIRRATYYKHLAEKNTGRLHLFYNFSDFPVTSGGTCVFLICKSIYLEPIFTTT